MFHELQAEACIEGRVSAVRAHLTDYDEMKLTWNNGSVKRFSWSDAIRGPEELVRDIGTFQIIEGTILQAADVRGTIYLNFGEDWRTDFTVSIRKRARKTFVNEDPASWNGRKIRVRGWLKSRNGPMIEATHAEQIELLEDK